MTGPRTSSTLWSHNSLHYDEALDDPILRGVQAIIGDGPYTHTTILYPPGARTCLLIGSFSRELRHAGISGLNMRLYKIRELK
ncbi:hypothetical protein AVEN_57145-1 [Araneus ventricosus]|uniref:Uncharacterized protein n=1 Tax=Araneus ventricosus TaxID=182803 RepID=A0A4Y2PJL7_ARAVE|nr:hypothetical protein AVEN_57145-1 [Araneus ventricosus]